jgi:hypothetical protein
MPTRKSSDEESSAPEPQQEQVTTEAAPEEVVQKQEPTNVVRYTGLVSERRISREDWEQAGVSDQDGVVWTKDANNIVPIDQFSEEALQVLANTGEFEVIRDVKD